MGEVDNAAIFQRLGTLVTEVREQGRRIEGMRRIERHLDLPPFAAA